MKRNKSIVNNNQIEINNLKIFLLLSLSTLFYLSYLITGNLIHSIGNPTNYNDISPWQIFSNSRDGIELYVEFQIKSGQNKINLRQHF